MSTLLKVSAPIAERVVAISGSGGFAVRGINPLQIVALYRRHSTELEPIFTSTVTKGQVDLTDLIVALLNEAPILMAEVIAVASGGDPGNMVDVTVSDPVSREPIIMPAFEAAAMIARNLPFPVQIDALTKIAELTFTQDMPAGKFAALAVTLLRKATGAVEAVAFQAAQNGSGTFESPSVS